MDDDDDAASFSASLAGGIGGIPARRGGYGVTSGRDDDDDDAASVGGRSTAAGSVATFATGTSAGTGVGGSGMTVEALKRALDSLPEPQYDVDVVVPSEQDIRQARRRVRRAAKKAARPGSKAMVDDDEDEDEDEGGDGSGEQDVEDAEVVRAREQAMAREQEEREKEKASAALLARPTLPRPWIRNAVHLKVARHGGLASSSSLAGTQGSDSESNPDSGSRAAGDVAMEDGGDESLLAGVTGGVTSEELRRAGAAIRSEMVLMARRDDELVPQAGEGSLEVRGAAGPLDSASAQLPSLPDEDLQDKVSVEQLARARALVDAEVSAVGAAAVLGPLDGGWVSDPFVKVPSPSGVPAATAARVVGRLHSAFAGAWGEASELESVAALSGVTSASSSSSASSPDERLRQLQAAHRRLRNLVLASRRRALGSARAWEGEPAHRNAMQAVAEAEAGLQQLGQGLSAARVQLTGYSELDRQEEAAVIVRRANLRQELQGVEGRQEALQRRYKAAALEIGRLQAMLAQHEGQGQG